MTLADAHASAVAAWTLDEASGTRNDQVGSNHLTDNNTVGSAVGKFGNAADFERDNSEYLSIVDNAALSMGDIDFMIRCWVRIETSAASLIIVAKDDVTANREYTLYYSTSGGARFRFSVSGDGSAVTIVPANNLGIPAEATDYLIHAWHDATNNVIGIAVNGGTANTAAHSTGVFNGAAPFRIGAHHATPVSFFDGLIDDVVILKNRILDATERTADYNSGNGVAFADWVSAPSSSPSSSPSASPSQSPSASPSSSPSASPQEPIEYFYILKAKGVSSDSAWSNVASDVIG